MENEITNCSEDCTCKSEKKKCACKEKIASLEAEKSELNDKYLRLYSDFENYKRRSQKEKEDTINGVTTKILSSILDIDSDLALAKKSIASETDRAGIDLIFDKIKTFLKSYNIEEIQTDVYDSELHDVVTTVPIGEKKIVDVISKGYLINGKPFRYPKIVLGE